MTYIVGASGAERMPGAAFIAFMVARPVFYSLLARPIL